MIVTLEDMKRHLNIPWENSEDDMVVDQKIKAAEAHISRLLGYSLETGFEPGVVPDDLKEAVCQLAAHWYENREAVIVGVSAQHVPYSVREIVREYQNWSF